MKCIILAAGYATRLYPLTRKIPKPLIKVQGKPIINWLLQDVGRLNQINEIIIVSNHRFYKDFLQWTAQYKDTPLVPEHMKISILDDGSTENENRLGAVSDIAFAIKQCHLQEDILVVAGDNMLDFSLKGFLDYFAEKRTTCIMRYFENALDNLRKTGVIQIDEQEKVLKMQEKPEMPESNWAVPPFYIYHQRDLQTIIKAVETECVSKDAPGDFIAWFCQRHPVYAYKMEGKRYDIGDICSLELARKYFEAHEI